MTFCSFGDMLRVPGSGTDLLRVRAAAGLANFAVLAAHVVVLPAMEAVLASDGNEVQGFLAAGHVCAVTGFDHYHALCDR